MRRELEKHEPALSDSVKLIFTDAVRRAGESWWVQGGGGGDLTAIECRLFTY